MRERAAAIFAAVLVAGVVGLSIWILGSRQTIDPSEAGTAALTEFVEEWERGDFDAMVARTFSDVEAEAIVAVYEQLDEALEPEALTVTLTDLAAGPAQVTATATVAFDLRDGGTFEYAVPLVIERGRGGWRVLWDYRSVHPELREGFTFAVTRSATARAPILGNGGVALSGQGVVHTLGIEPRRIEDPADLQSRVEALLPEGADALADLLERDDLVPDWFYPFVTLRQERFEGVWDRLRPVPGMVHRETQGRLAEDVDTFARHVLGRVGPPTAEILEQNPGVYEDGDEIGLYGLEAVFEDRLVGGHRLKVQILEPDGDVHAIVHTFDDNPADPVETTLDVDVQNAAERALVGTNIEAALVAVEQGTGAIRATASRPLNGYNRAFEGRYPPGPGAMLIPAEILLASGASTDDKVDCRDSLRVGGLLISNERRSSDEDDDGGKKVTVAEAFATGCLTTVADIAGRLPSETLLQGARRFGFRADWAPLPLNAFEGSYPEPRDSAERAAAGIGRARVEASVLHLASLAAGAVEGRWFPPFLLTDDGPREGLALSPDVENGLREILEDGAVANGFDFDRGRVGALAGVARVGGSVHSWVVGFVDELGFAVLIEGRDDLDAARSLAERFAKELTVLRR